MDLVKCIDLSLSGELEVVQPSTPVETLVTVHPEEFELAI
jgi:hypothetical protein